MFRSYFYDFFTKITHLDSPVACLDLLFRYICIYTHVPISCFIMQLLIFGSMCTHISTFANPWAVGQNNIAVESSFIFIWMDNEIQEPKKSTIFDFFSSSILRYYYYLFWLPQFEKKMPMVQLSNSRISFFQKIFSLKTNFWSVALLMNGPPIFPAHPIPFICAMHCIICIVFVGT